MSERWAEIAMGIVVLALAAAFLIYSLSVGGGGERSGNYELTARFGEVGALAPGAGVRVAGVKVGTVSAITLDPKNYMALTRLSIRSSVKLPSDSTAKITSDGLLGGAHIAIMPGGAPDDLKSGAEIENTQGAVDLFSLIGQVVRPQAPASPQPGPTAPAAPDAR